MDLIFRNSPILVTPTSRSIERHNIKKLMELLEQAEYAKNMRYDIDFTQNFFKAVKKHIA